MSTDREGKTSSGEITESDRASRKGDTLPGQLVCVRESDMRVMIVVSSCTIVSIELSCRGGMGPQPKPKQGGEEGKGEFNVERSHSRVNVSRNSGWRHSGF